MLFSRTTNHLYDPFCTEYGLCSVVYHFLMNKSLRLSKSLSNFAEIFSTHRSSKRKLTREGRARDNGMPDKPTNTTT